MFPGFALQQGQDAMQLLQQQQQQQQEVAVGVYGSSPKQSSSLLSMNMLGTRQQPGMKFISDTPSVELEELLPCELSSCSISSMPARFASSQQQQQQLLLSGSFLHAPVTANSSSNAGHDSSSSSTKGAANNPTTPFLAAAYQLQQLPPLQPQQLQMLLPDHSSSSSGEMISANAWHQEFALAPHGGSIPMDGAFIGASAMSNVLSGSSSNAAHCQWQELASPHQQQQYQPGQGSSPLPRLPEDDSALLDLHRQLAAVSLTADMPLASAAAAAAAAASSSSNCMPLLLPRACSSASNSEALAGASPPIPGSPLRSVIDEEIMRLLKVSFWHAILHIHIIF
jgi:hypothetical protein